MNKDAELDMKDVELNEVDSEKQPMTGGGGETGNGDASSPLTEKNGTVKVKIPEEKEEKFTGLSKEELLQVAGTPGWVRTRWVLLVLFWLGWIGMLAGAIAIIVQAPRCRPLPEMNWWNLGPLYQVGDVRSFTESGNLEGLQAKISSLGQLKMKGLLLGPIHISNADKPEDLNLKEIAYDVGNLDNLKSLIHEAKRKSIPVVLDLTPNYKGSQPWFSADQVQPVANKLLDAADYWLQQGVAGILLYDVETVATEVPTFWPNMKEIIENNTENGKKVLIGVTNETSPDAVSDLLNMTGVDLLLSGVLERSFGMKVAEAVDRLYSHWNQTQLAWNIGDRIRGHLASIVGPLSMKLSQLMLNTLPGTPIFNYGDEIGLEDDPSGFPAMVWNAPEKAENESEQADSQRSTLSFFRTLSDVREKERSLQHGDYVPLYNSSSTLAYMRSWDQNQRFVVALNWDPTNSAKLQLSHVDLPAGATVVISTDGNPASGNAVTLSQLELKPLQGVLLKFPYVG